MNFIPIISSQQPGRSLLISPFGKQDNLRVNYKAYLCDRENTRRLGERIHLQQSTCPPVDAAYNCPNTTRNEEHRPTHWQTKLNDDHATVGPGKLASVFSNLLIWMNVRITECEIMARTRFGNDKIYFSEV